MDSPAVNFMQNELNWDNYIANCQEISGLTNDEKEVAKESLIYLKSIFGEKFLQRVYDPNTKQFRHPLGTYLFSSC